MTFVISFALTFSVFVLAHYPEYVCHGSWTENDTTFIIARHAGTKHGVCISFKPSTTDSTAAQLIVGDSCYRETMSSEIPEHHLISNVTGIVREYFAVNALSFVSGLPFLIKSPCTLCGKTQKTIVKVVFGKMCTEFEVINKAFNKLCYVVLNKL